MLVVNTTNILMNNQYYSDRINYYLKIYATKPNIIIPIRRTVVIRPPNKYCKMKKTYQIKKYFRYLLITGGINSYRHNYLLKNTPPLSQLLVFPQPLMFFVSTK